MAFHKYNAYNNNSLKYSIFNIYVKSCQIQVEKGSVLKLAQFTILFLSIPVILVSIFNFSAIKTVKQHVQNRQLFLCSPHFLTASISLAVFTAVVLLRYMQSRLLMNFEFRFFVPFFPVFLFFAAVFLDWGFAGVQSLKEKKKVMYSGIIVFALILMSAQGYIYLKEYKKYAFLKDGYKQMIESEHIPAGIFIRDNTPQDEWVNVIHDVGAIPYYSERKTVDFSRLNNEILAKKYMTKSEIADYFFSFNPGAVVLTSYKWDKVFQPWYYGDESKMITEDPRFDKYKLVRKFRTDISENHPAHDYFEFVYLRKDLIK